MEDTIILVDLSAIYWSAWHATANTAVSEAFALSLSAVKRLTDGARHVAICCDSGRSFRKDIFPEYKANRPEKDHAAIGELERLCARLKQDGYLLWAAAGFEADDIIATATVRALESGRRVQICTGDKDLLQLVEPRVQVVNTRNGAVIDEAGVKEKFGVAPSQVADYLALVGDKSDNIPGVNGVGSVRAAKLLAECGDLKGIYSALYANRETFATSAIRAALTEAAAFIDTSRQLVALRTDVPISFEEIFAERQPQKLTNGGMDDMDAPPPEEIAPDPDQTEQAKRIASEPQPKPPVEVQSVAMVRAPVEYERQLEPADLSTAYRLAGGIFNSRLYERYKTQEAIWAVIIRGREMGIGALTALDCFHVIEGKPAPHAHLIIARAKAHADCEYFQCIESTGKSATWETKNRNNPKPTRLTYTLDEATAAGLTAPPRDGKKPGPWLTRQAEMLRKTAGVQLARMEYPDAALGLYAAEELGAEI